MSNSFCASRPSFSASTKASRHRDHRDAEDHVVADFRRLAVARPRPHARWSCPWLRGSAAACANASSAAADHESERAALRAADAARDRRIDHRQALRLGRRRATARAVSTSMVEQSISSVPGLALPTMPSRTEIDLAHLLAGGQHGDDDLGIGRGDRRGTRAAPCRRRTHRFRRLRADVEAVHRVAGLDQVLRHGRAHIAEPDESDLRHHSLPCIFRSSAYFLVMRHARAPRTIAARASVAASSVEQHQERAAVESAESTHAGAAIGSAAAISHTTAPQAAASHKPTAGTRSMMAKKTVADLRTERLGRETAHPARRRSPSTTAQWYSPLSIETAGHRPQEQHQPARPACPDSCVLRGLDRLERASARDRSQVAHGSVQLARPSRREMRRRPSPRSPRRGRAAASAARCPCRRSPRARLRRNRDHGRSGDTMRNSVRMQASKSNASARSASARARASGWSAIWCGCRRCSRGEGGIVGDLPRLRRSSAARISSTRAPANRRVDEPRAAAPAAPGPARLRESGEHRIRPASSAHSASSRSANRADVTRWVATPDATASAALSARRSARDRCRSSPGSRGSSLGRADIREKADADLRHGERDTRRPRRDASRASRCRRRRP